MMLNEISQTLKDKCHRIPLRGGDSIETESGMVVARGRGEGKLFDRWSFSLGGWKVLETDDGDGCSTV